MDTEIDTFMYFWGKLFHTLVLFHMEPYINVLMFIVVRVELPRRTLYIHLNYLCLPIYLLLNNSTTRF